MSIKEVSSVARYITRVADIRAAIANLSRFVDSLPAPDDNGTLPSLHYGHLGSLAEMHDSLINAVAATEHFYASHSY